MRCHSLAIELLYGLNHCFVSFSVVTISFAEILLVPFLVLYFVSQTGVATDIKGELCIDTYKSGLQPDRMSECVQIIVHALGKTWLLLPVRAFLTRVFPILP
jgi:hypothetical protein